MQLNAHLDVELVAVEQADELCVLLELRAPEPPPTAQRAPTAVQVVLDRSGSMAGERLEAATRALAALVDRLDPADRFGVVAFDDEVDVVVPAGPVADKALLRRAVLAVAPGGSTNLSGGLLRGVQEARRVPVDGGATVLLLSDGHANAGVTDADRLAGVAATARGHGLTVSTVGVGLGYDERLLAGLARAGGGSHVFAEDGDGAAAAVAGEVEGLLSKSVQAASLTIRPAPSVRVVKLWNDLPSHPVDDGVAVELGDLWAGEERKVLLALGVPAMPALGLAEVARLELRHVALPELVEHVVELPLHVNVVPGDEAAGRVADPEVRRELLFQQVQEAKRRAADLMEDGDLGAAQAVLREAGAQLAAEPAAAGGELAEEADVVERLARRLREGDAAWSAKMSRMEHHRKAHRRGRRA